MPVEIRYGLQSLDVAARSVLRVLERPVFALNAHPVGILTLLENARLLYQRAPLVNFRLLPLRLPRTLCVQAAMQVLGLLRLARHRHPHAMLAMQAHTRVLLGQLLPPRV